MNANEPEGLSTREVLTGLIRHPIQHVVWRWNWKSAVLSSLVRSALFFVANLSAGLSAARAAFVTELLFRAATAGFYGALTQAFRPARPAWTGTIAAMVILPVASHLTEFAVHWLRGTPRLAASLTASVAFTLVSTSFNLFAMRRGAFIVGAGRASLWSDLRRVPRLVAAFAAAVLCALNRIVKSGIRTLMMAS